MQLHYGLVRLPHQSGRYDQPPPLPRMGRWQGLAASATRAARPLTPPVLGRLMASSARPVPAILRASYRALPAPPALRQRFPPVGGSTFPVPCQRLVQRLVQSLATGRATGLVTQSVRPQARPQQVAPLLSPHPSAPVSPRTQSPARMRNATRDDRNLIDHAGSGREL